MDGIVIELEKEALDKNVSTEELLRKAYLVARKLKLSDFEEWINNEQNGYEGEVPDYRRVCGDYKAWNPYRGWIPVILSVDVAKVISRVPLHNSVSSLWDIYSTSDVGISFTIGAEMTKFLNDSTDGFETNYAFFSSRSEIYRILSTVRNKILDWTLLLEENNIIGEGMSFTEEEKKTAKETQIINNYTNNFYSTVSDIDMKQGE